ncbi:MAG: tetratricopeptide repeat protein [Treponema sp.]|jgi:tetratricopeptide (TPR) repeat protein|nr:tetratricopeptide repeat protein [Treponema sp.]
MNVQEYLKRGESSFNQEDFDRAIADFIEACRLDPNLEAAKKDLLAAYFNRGVATYQKGDIGQAIADLTEAIRLNPNDDQLYGARGMMYKEKGNHDEAIKDFTEVIRLAPDLTAYSSRSSGYYSKCKESRAAGDERNFFKYIDLAIKDNQAALQIIDNDIAWKKYEDPLRIQLKSMTEERELRKKVYEGIRNIGNLGL